MQARFFFYCYDSQAWHFDVVSDIKSVKCAHWLLQSYKQDGVMSDIYDSLSHASASWLSQDQEHGIKGGVRAAISFMGYWFQQCFICKY
jgi:hypothetical protein